MNIKKIKSFCLSTLFIFQVSKTFVSVWKNSKIDRSNSSNLPFSYLRHLLSRPICFPRWWCFLRWQCIFPVCLWRWQRRPFRGTRTPATASHSKTKLLTQTNNTTNTIMIFPYMVTVTVGCNRALTPSSIRFNRIRGLGFPTWLALKIRCRSLNWLARQRKLASHWLRF